MDARILRHHAYFRSSEGSQTPAPPVLPTFRLRLSTVVQSPEMTTTEAAAPTFDQGGNLINSCFGLRTPIGAVHIELFGNCEMP